MPVVYELLIEIIVEVSSFLYHLYVIEQLELLGINEGIVKVILSGIVSSCAIGLKKYTYV